jgi:hypothetical protein
MERGNTFIYQGFMKASSKIFANRGEVSNLFPMATTSSEITRMVNQTERANMNGATVPTTRANSLMALKRAKAPGIKMPTLITKAPFTRIKNMVRELSTIKTEVTWRGFLLMEL